MINLIQDITIYDVVLSIYDKETGEYGEWADSTYIISPEPMEEDEIYKLANLRYHGYRAEVYEARSADLYYYKGKLSVEEADTSTGYNETPLYVRHYDENGDLLYYDE